MTLPEFITYCKLAGYVIKHEELDVPNWDHQAEKYFMLHLQGRGYSSRIKYATIGDQGAVIAVTLTNHKQGGASLGAELSDVKNAFIPE